LEAGFADDFVYVTWGIQTDTAAGAGTMTRTVKYWAICALLCLSGCTPFILQGVVSTAWHQAPPNQPTFTIVSQDQLSLTDQHIASLIADKLISQGYAKAESLSKADVGVLYSFRVGQGVTHTTGVPDYATGGTLIGSSTSYPRFLEIILVDLHRSKIPESVKVIWQGEIRSSGSISNMSALAPGFVDVIFENYGTTVSNKSFTRVP
jgi:hypothetical protein